MRWNGTGRRCPLFGVRVVADDQRDVARQLAGLVPVEQVHQAWSYFETNSGTRTGWSERSSRHRISNRSASGANRRGNSTRLRAEPGEVPLDAHQEQLPLAVLVLVA